MTYQVLARKWRPQNFTQLVGQEHVSQSLSNALQHDRLHHAYLFTGTRGVGKTTIARILAKAINCENLQDSNPCGECQVCIAFQEGRFLDLIEVDAASRTKVEDTRDLLDNAQYAPNQGRYKVYLIDEVHMLSGHSFNALLKTLEEPPPHVKFLLATTDTQKIPVTVLSRCLQFNLKRLLPEQIDAQMTYILGQERIDFEPSALKLLSRAADGSMRDGLSLLDQAIAFGNGEVKQETVTQMLGSVAQQPVDDILLALANNNAVQLLQKISEISELTPDFSEILQQILRVFHRVSLAQTISGFVDNEFDSDIIAQLASTLLAEDVQLFYQIGLIGQRDLELAPDPRCGFEMVMLRMLTFRPVSDYSIKTKNNPIAKKPEIQDIKRLEPSPIKNRLVSKTIKEPTALKVQVLSDNNWAEMVVAMNLKGMTRELANNCILETIDDSTCTLVLEQNHTHLISSRAKENLQKGLCSYYNKEVKLNIKTETVKQITPAQQITQKQADTQQAAVDSINKDENIRAFKEHFDARVMPGTIEPH
jgi:DNA polymerase-3 subunit gamma/tau